MEVDDVAQTAARAVFDEEATASILPGTERPAAVRPSFLQRRLGVFARTGALLIALFLALFNLVNLLNPRYPWTHWLVNPSNLLHLTALGCLLAVWWVCRTGVRPPRTLVALDALGFWVISATFIASVWYADPSGSRHQAMLIEVTNALLFRAVIVPSPGRRTLWVGAAVLPFVTHAAWLFEVHRGSDAATTARHTLEAAVFCSMAIAISVLASRVIYGLRRRVADALRLGQYTLEEPLGAGAMGVVYRARHALLRRPTAIKVVSPKRASEATLRRFEREVRLTSQLTHPNTVAVYDYGRTPEGVFYCAMELLDGLNLDELVERHGPQPPARVAAILRQLCLALAEAHAAGLIHRDIKPANVILCERWGESDVVKVVDFGLVKEIGHDDARRPTVTGTPLYMSPEAIRRPDEVGPPSDLYGVGGVAYFLLTGTPPFPKGTTGEVFGHHLATPPTPPSERLGRPVPPSLEALVLACLAKDPTRRPASAAVLAAATAGCSDLGCWTQEDARRWWAEHRASPRRPAQAAGVSLPG